MKTDKYLTLFTGLVVFVSAVFYLIGTFVAFFYVLYIRSYLT